MSAEFTCGECGKGLRDENGVRSHMLVKHGEDAEMGPDFRYYRKSTVERFEADSGDDDDNISEGDSK